MEKDKIDHNAELRKRSGDINDERKLVGFLYLLMRDHLAVGDVEKMVRDTLIINGSGDVQFTNGWLAQIAQDMANRLI